MHRLRQRLAVQLESGHAPKADAALQTSLAIAELLVKQTRFIDCHSPVTIRPQPHVVVRSFCFTFPPRSCSVLICVLHTLAPWHRGTLTRYAEAEANFRTVLASQQRTHT